MEQNYQEYQKNRNIRNIKKKMIFLIFILPKIHKYINITKNIMTTKSIKMTILNEYLINTISEIVLNYDHDFNRRKLLGSLMSASTFSYWDEYPITQKIKLINECSKLIKEDTEFFNMVLDEYFAFVNLK